MTLGGNGVGQEEGHASFAMRAAGQGAEQGVLHRMPVKACAARVPGQRPCCRCAARQLCVQGGSRVAAFGSRCCGYAARARLLCPAAVQGGSGRMQQLVQLQNLQPLR